MKDSLPGNKKQYLIIWAVLCLLIVIVGIAIPVSETCSQGLEGANQANLVHTTDELVEGRVLEFTLEAPAGTSTQIGFFFSVNGHIFPDGTLRIMAYDQESGTLVGGREFPLEELTEDQFLFVDLDYAPSILSVRMSCDADEEGPSVWLNETTVTPGSAQIDGSYLEQSLVYNLTYTVQTHRVLQPILIGLILLLAGVGVFSAGGFVRLQRVEKKKSRDMAAGFTGKRVLGLGVALLCGALLFFYLYDTKIRIAQNSTERVTLLESNGETLPVNEDNASISQILKPEQDSLTGFGVRFFIEEGSVLTEGMMHAVVTDLTMSETLCETDISAGQFISGEYIGLLFEDSQTGVADHRYRIDLRFSEELWDSGLALITSDEGLCVNAHLYYNLFLKYYFFFFFLGVEAFLCLFWYLTFVRRVRIETVFLVTVLCLGLFYNVLLTPQMVPDEAKHIDMAYRYSNELLGYESLGDTTILMRADDAAIEFTSSPSLQNYRNIFYGLFSKVQDGSMVEAEVNSNTQGSLLFYVPAVSGMTLARLLGLGTVPMLLLARYLNLLVFALLAWAGMRRLPFGKLTLFVLALLPINMQQCTSFSHDAMVHGLIFLYACLCLEAIFSERRLTGQRLLALEILALTLIWCKSGSYAPLALLPLLIPAAHYGGKREKRTGTAALIGIPVLAFLLKNAATVAGIAGTTAAMSVVGTSDGSAYAAGYTLSYFLNDPLELVYMIVNMILDKGGFYLESLVGYKLGWVEIETSEMLVIFFLFLLFLSVLNVPGEQVCIRARERFWMLLLCAASAGLIVLGMLLSWTPLGYVSVEGVQGRYFLPFMPVLLAACRSQLICLRQRIDRMVMAAAVSGQILAIAYVIRQVTTV
ncbi:MAG: DUF2142 domain-containing protein [Lachnospiraceae bacterium]|nr:DUF2142 domain-containing protein [Lachnospiraceae bacterium]